MIQEQAQSLNWKIACHMHKLFPEKLIPAYYGIKVFDSWPLDFADSNYTDRAIDNLCSYVDSIK